LLEIEAMTIRQALVRLGWRYIEGTWPTMVFSSPGGNFVAFANEEKLQTIEPIEALSDIAQRQVLAGTVRAVEHPIVTAFVAAHRQEQPQ
jgi:hypothetical protein